MQIITLDGAQMTTIREAHLYIARQLRFPAYYGRNLDALYDCLTEYCPDMILILRNADAMRNNLGEYADRLNQVFEDAASDSHLRWIEDPS